jgi:hypothetical protein
MTKPFDYLVIAKRELIEQPSGLPVLIEFGLPFTTEHVLEDGRHVTDTTCRYQITIGNEMVAQSGAVGIDAVQAVELAIGIMDIFLASVAKERGTVIHYDDGTIYLGTPYEKANR